MTTITESTITGDIRTRAAGARTASRELAVSAAEKRDLALDAIAMLLEERREQILEANAQDLEIASSMVHRGELDEPLLKRLDLSGSKFETVIDMVRSVRAQDDPLGKTHSATELDQGLNLFRVSVPIGVLGVIFESRPDALVQISSLCLKSGNAVLLKGGREAANSNQILAQVVAEASQSVAGIPAGWLTLMQTREDVREMLNQEESIDLIIPRGGNQFVQYIMKNTRIPVMGHADGICHVFVDRAADLDKAVRIAVDSKTQYVGVCNAAETLLVHADVAEAFFGKAVSVLAAEKVEIRGDERTVKLAGKWASVTPATDEDWGTEYLDSILSVKVVDDLNEAIIHINHYGSGHTDAIITEDGVTATEFLRGVDSASVFHNASTRFADGYAYGLGAEVGISTGRLHSRGPVGLEGLTIYKYILEGTGQTIAEYQGEVRRPYSHRRLDADWCPGNGLGNGTP